MKKKNDIITKAEFWIARNANRRLYMYIDKPTRHNEYFLSVGESTSISSDLFKEVTFENSPRKVKLILEKK